MRLCLFFELTSVRAKELVESIEGARKITKKIINYFLISLASINNKLKHSTSNFFCIFILTFSIL
jgi:hypothetical protein